MNGGFWIAVLPPGAARSRWLRKGPGLYSVLAAFLVIAVNVAAAFFVIAPSQEGLAALERSAAGLRTRGDTARSIERALSDVGGFEKRLLTEKKGLTTVINEVFRAAARNGLDIQSSEYASGGEGDTGLSHYSISFPVEGRYGKIRKFIHDLETLDRQLVIDEITFSRSKASRGTIELTMRLSVYFRKAGPEAL